MDINSVLYVFAGSLRNQADADYITSRAAWKMQLREQFLWSALQAIEKHLKAILLFNARSARWENLPPLTSKKKTREYGHDLKRLLLAVRGIERLNLELPDWTDDFISAINNFGENRYLTISTYSLPEWLSHLDETIWSIRRYAQSFEHVGTIDGDEKDLLPILLAVVNNPVNREFPSRYRPFHGFLEMVIDRQHQDHARKTLIWNNHFFGSRTRRKLRYQSWVSSQIPPQERDWFINGKWKDSIESYIKL